MIEAATGSAIIAAVQCVFGIALLPTVMDSAARVPRSSSGITAAGLWAIAAVYALMGLWAAALAAGSTAGMWTLIFVYRA